MTKAYPYPEDEFDIDPGEGDVPQGAHRAPRSRLRGALVALSVLVAAGALGVAAAIYVPAWLGLNASDIATTVGFETTTTTPSQSATSDDAKSDEAGADDAGAEDGDSDQKTTDSDATETPEDAAEQIEEEPEEPAVIDKATAVRVLNATRTQGLAAAAASKLEAEGWSDLNATNYTGAAISSSIVYYKTEDDEAAAESIAETLGIGSTKLVTNLTGPISVVLASDYRS